MILEFPLDARLDLSDLAFEGATVTFETQCWCGKEYFLDKGLRMQCSILD